MFQPCAPITPCRYLIARSGRGACACATVTNASASAAPSDESNGLLHAGVSGIECDRSRWRGGCWIDGGCLGRGARRRPGNPVRCGRRLESKQRTGRDYSRNRAARHPGGDAAGLRAPRPAQAVTRNPPSRRIAPARSSSPTIIAAMSAGGIRNTRRVEVAVDADVGEVLGQLGQRHPPHVEQRERQQRLGHVPRDAGGVGLERGEARVGALQRRGHVGERLAVAGDDDARVERGDACRAWRASPAARPGRARAAAPGRSRAPTARRRKSGSGARGSRTPARPCRGRARRARATRGRPRRARCRAERPRRR